MKNAALGCLLSALVALVATPAAAQLELPAPSPAAKVSQEVGVTEISIDYSSPGVKGRKVWGDVVPWDKAWRTGANAATKITFSRDVTFGGKAVPAGTYTIVSMPSQKGWKVMLNKDLTLWSGGNPYDAKQDVASVAATTAEVPNRERLTFLFSNTTDDSTSLDLEWEKLRVSVPIKVDTAAHAKANIAAAQNSTASMQMAAARYIADSTKDYATALKHADASVAIQSNWFNNWIRADILARMGNYAEARKSAQIAWDLGNKDKNFFFRDQVSKALADWKNK
ncbi:DUF2911 domain-containing protein [Pyxidicoccus xibeiensis]|uniref:DUF2911 domain-containing protein n=1 Tax=Pyxidicoccus xibeiensis TaxID=2906759 RepID=UPI0020A73CCF|nr:DUF2911 domain-containing protein [Pyxidicoccus xibeiensis]MCP3141504.1 DUF2911 domain-containing protein [Pyxidicoccus xibeiensis]